MGEKVLIGPLPTGEAANFDHGQTVQWVSHNGGEWWGQDALIVDCHYYLENEDEYVKWVGIDPNSEHKGKFVLDPGFLSLGIWDSLFSVTAISMAGNNITQACYDYLKLLPEFENAIDG
jgi:hypothetical protein